MMDLILKQIDKPYGSPLARVLVQATAELSNAGLLDGLGTPDWDCKAIYAEVDGIIVGFICYKTLDWLQSITIALGYVSPPFRRQGIYSRLYAALVKLATDQKMRSITGYTDVNNTALQAVAVHQGRKLVTLGYRHDLLWSQETLAEAT